MKQRRTIEHIIFSISLKLLLILALLLFSSPLLAADWYVDKDAHGQSNGTSWGDAWTIFTAIQWGTYGVKAGDTLYISGGTSAKTYDETLNVGASGTGGSPITITIGQASPHNGQVIIDGQSTRAFAINISSKVYITLTGQVGTGADPKIRLTGSSSAGLAISGASYGFDISYLEIDNNGTSADTDGIWMNLAQPYSNMGEIHHNKVHDNYQDGLHLVRGGSVYTGSSYGSLKIHHNDIYNTHDDGIECAIGSVDIYNNTIRDRITPARGHPDGIQVYDSYVRIYSNNFYGNSPPTDNGGNSDIFLDPFEASVPNPNHFQVFNNVLSESEVPQAGSAFRAMDIKFNESNTDGVSDVLIANNTVTGTPFSGLYLQFGNYGSAAVSNIVIENNIFLDAVRSGYGSAVLIFSTGNGSVTYGSHGDSADVVVDHNVAYASSGTYSTDVSYGGSTMSYNSFKTASGAQDNDVTQDPSLDAFLRPDSQMAPVVDYGTDLSQYFLVDYLDNLRPQGLAWDIGSFEYIGNKPNPPTNLMLTN